MAHSRLDFHSPFGKRAAISPMTSQSIPSVAHPQRSSAGFMQSLLLPGALALAVVGGGALLAQVGGERGIMPVASSTDIEVSGIEVNATGDNAEDARRNGYLQAQRKAWEQLDGPEVPDSQLESMVSAIVVEQEQLGPRRYIARLGVIFDRARAGGALGGNGERARSAPMLTLPVLLGGGTGTVFESRNVWQRAWAEYQFGASTIDYVRPEGAGGESLLLTYGQTGRRSRAWWSTILDQFSAADVLVPIARLEYEYPGGPVIGHFTARHGPDNRRLGGFDLRAANPSQLPAMLRTAVTRLDEIYRRALAQGVLTPDPSLTVDNVELSPEILALLEQGRLADAAAGADEAGETASITSQPVPDAGEAAAITTVTVQAATPDPRAFDAALAGLRSVGGVRGVAVSSTAIGGTSVMQVTFAGDAAALAAALRGSGWQVAEGGSALSISR
jgi:hypothetical protein